MAKRITRSFYNAEDIISDQEIANPEICSIPSIKEYIETHSGISDDILDAYEFKVQSLIVRPPEYKKNINGFISEFRDKFYHPFEVKVYGAYPLVTDWIRLNKIMEVADDRKAQTDYISEALEKNPNYRPINFSYYKKPVIFEGLKEYARGYKFGFDNFITSFIDTPSGISDSVEFKIQRMFDFWSSDISHPTSFQEISIEDSRNQALKKWYEDGIRAGYDYHSWYYLFINRSYFETYFNKSQEGNAAFDFSSIFNKKNNAFKICLSLFEELEITIDHRRNLKKGRAGNLFGLIIAIKHSPGMLRADYSEAQLLEYFNEHLGSKYKVVSKRSIGYDGAYDFAIKYLKKHFNKSIT